MNRLTPSDRATSLLELMKDRDGIKREVISETLDSKRGGQILESGRTFCSTPRQVHGPINRFPKAVDLPQCPTGAGGAWHTHITYDEMKNPSNSLPDIATVVFGQLDLMAVVGTETAEYFLSASDPEAMRHEFNDAVGEAIDSPDQLLNSIDSGRMVPGPARERVRDRLRPLFHTERTGFSDLTERVDQKFGAQAASPQYEMVELHMIGGSMDYSTSMCDPKSTNHYTSMMAANAEQTIRERVPVNIAETAAGAAVGTIVGNIVENVLFD